MGCVSSRLSDWSLIMKKQVLPEKGHSPEEFIEVFGAKEHNLKNIDISIPKNKLVC
jgi:excinuclease UvrABC ATPase subunit